MSARSTRFPPLAALLLAWPAGATAPVTARYRIDQTLTQEVDATAAGQGKQSITFSTSSFVTVTLADTAGGRTVHVVVDSMRGDSANPIPASVMDSARGAAYHAFLSSAGRLDQLQPMTDVPAASQVQGLLSDFYPWVRAGLKVGQSWADTTTRTTIGGPDTVTVRRITLYRAAASETRDKRKAVRITSDFTSTVDGTQTTPRGSARINGTSTGSGTYYVTPDGQYLGGEWQLRSALHLAGAFAPEPLPITLSQTIRVTTLK